MDLWQSDRAFAEDSKFHTTGRILADASGNIQSFSTNVKHEFSKRGASDGTKRSCLLGSSDQQTYPPPRATLGSNDNQTAIRQKLNARKLRRRIHFARPYLSHPLYLKYRDRARKDVDKHGRVIWPDDVENAFQNALLYIPPMGRRKKSQHGRPCGRNELISEWIYHATGQQRGRKQVSSHLQVLGNLLKHIPEWRAVNDEGESNNHGEGDTNPYYNNSIEDMVRHSRQLQDDPCDQMSDSDERHLPSHMLQSHGSVVDRHRVNRLEFEMSVCPSRNMEDKFHRYTTSQSDLTRAAPIPLDDIRGWRFSFPDLVPIIDSSIPIDGPDIILLSANLRLMRDFPPEPSKLCINFELEFSERDPEVLQRLDDLRSWSCVTQTYHRGKLLRISEDKRCSVSRANTVRPRFESAWWAQEFVRLTDKRRRAQESENDAAVAAADECASNFLQSLSMMQQIFVTPDDTDLSQHVWSDPGYKNGSKPERAVILLWTFSQASADFVGTTTWQKLIPPFQSATGNTPPPSSSHPAMLSFAVDNTVERSFSHALRRSSTYHYEANQVNHDYSPNIDEELCQDGFMILSQQTDLDPMASSLGTSTMYDHGGQSHFPPITNFDLGTHPNDFNEYGCQVRAPSIPQAMFSANYFENEGPSVPNPGFEHQEGLPQQRQQLDMVPHGQSIGAPREPLATFDSNTHDSLQAQLSRPQGEGRGMYHEQEVPDSQHLDVSHHQGISEIDDEVLRNALMAAATMDNIPGEPAKQDRNDSSALTCLAPTAIRPVLQQHHSFAGALPTELMTVHETPREDFARLLESMEANHEDLFGANNLLSQSTPNRAHSQPPPFSRQHEPSELFILDGELHESFNRVKAEELPGL